MPESKSDEKIGNAIVNHIFTDPTMGSVAFLSLITLIFAIFTAAEKIPIINLSLYPLGRVLFASITIPLILILIWTVISFSRNIGKVKELTKEPAKLDQVIPQSDNVSTIERDMKKKLSQRIVAELIKFHHPQIEFVDAFEIYQLFNEKEIIFKEHYDQLITHLFPNKDAETK